MEEIEKQLKSRNFINIISYYTLKWAQNILMINDRRIPMWVYEYIPAGRRNVVRPGKRWTDQHLYVERTILDD